MSSYDRSSDEDRRKHRRRRSTSRERDRRPRHRTPTPPPPPPRDENLLPTEFGRAPDDCIVDKNNILQRMKTMENTRSPLGSVNEVIESQRKVKVWTRNFKEVRGILTGYILAFDKHWNLIMRDVEEFYVKPRKAKTPFLFDVAKDLPELPPKVPKKKKTEEEKKEYEAKVKAEKAALIEAEKKAEDERRAAAAAAGTLDEFEAAEMKAKAKKKRKRKKKTPAVGQRHVNQLFVRGDNIVMLSLMEEAQVEEEDTCQ